MYYKYGGTLFLAIVQTEFAKTICQKRIKVCYLKQKVLFVVEIKQSMFMQLSVEITIPGMLITENLNDT